MRIYLDTNAFIAAIEGWEQSDTHRALWSLFDLSEQRGGILVTSELSLAELLVKPLEMGLATVATGYLDLIANSRGLTAVHVNRGILILAAHIRKDDKSIKLPDAIHLATADHAECSIILTNDRHMASKRPQQCRQIAAAVIEETMQEITR